VDLVRADEGYDHELELPSAVEDGAADGLEMRREDHVHVPGLDDELAVRVGPAPRRVERAADDHLVAAIAQGIEIFGRAVRTGGQDPHGGLLHGFLQMTLRRACRFSTRTARSARSSAAGSSAGFSTRSAWPPDARPISS